MNHILLHVSLPEFQEKILKEKWLPKPFIEEIYDNPKAIDNRIASREQLKYLKERGELFVIDIEIKGARRA